METEVVRDLKLAIAVVLLIVAIVAVTGVFVSTL